MNQISVRALFGQYLAELLQGPFRRGMRGHIGMHDRASSQLHYDQYIKDAEVIRYNREEIASHNRVGMIANEGQPALAAIRCAACWLPLQVFADSSRRCTDSQLELEFVGNPLFTSGDVVGSDGSDQCTDLRRQWRATGWFGFPAPEQPESLSVPADQSFRLDHHQSVPPVEEPAQGRHQPTGRIVEALRFDFPLLKQGELFAEEQILGGKSGAGSQEKNREQAEPGHHSPTKT